MPRSKISLEAVAPTRRAFLAGTVGAAASMSSVTIAQTLSGSSAPNFDVIIVGGGSAGAPLANRLSVDPNRSVLLLEAGPSYSAEGYPESVRLQSGRGDAQHIWQFRSEPGWAGVPVPAPAGKVLGGSSAINAGIAMRAIEDDFLRWAREGLPNWSLSDVIPFYMRSERTTQGPDSLRGRLGPLPVHQLKAEEVSDLQNAFIASTISEGYPAAEDFNGPNPYGVGPYSVNNRAGDRLNTGMTFLSSRVRARKNLTIRSQTMVDRVEVSNGRAMAVILENGERIVGGEIVLSAGTCNSAAILLRSGIGPAQDLQQLGISAVANLPVGRRVQDHPTYRITYAAAADRIGLPAPRAGAMLCARSTLAKPEEIDLHVFPLHTGDVSLSPTGAVFSVMVALTRPKSVGTIKIRDRKANTPPLIHLNLLNEPNDRARMLEGVEIARRISGAGPMKDMIFQELVPGPLIKDRAALEQSIGRSLDTYHHYSSSAPMGGENDPHAVLDWQGRVRGIECLRVCDASMFPDVPSCAPNLTVIMGAERIASLIGS